MNECCEVENYVEGKGGKVDIRGKRIMKVK